LSRFYLFHSASTTVLYTLSLHDALPISKATGSNPVGRTNSLSSQGVARGRTTSQELATAGTWGQRICTGVFDGVGKAVSQRVAGRRVGSRGAVLSLL